MRLDLSKDVVSLTEDVVNIESVSFNEQLIADECERELRALGAYDLTRRGHTIVARTQLGLAQRVVIAGHLDTVPLNNNLPAYRVDSPSGELLYGLGTCDMKGGVACILKLAKLLAETGNPAAAGLNRDVTFILYEAEEIDSVHNGLAKLAASDPNLLAADFAILMEPSNGVVEAGCQGTMRVTVTTSGERAHSARAWRGVNAIHGAADVLNRLNAYQPRRPVIDGLEYYEGLNAVSISGGVAGNVLPDECVIEVNYRFAPDRSEAEAIQFVTDFFAPHPVAVTDIMGGALPGLERPAAAAFLELVDGVANPKFGWTDVARFSALGIPAVNFGPGDPMFAHKQDEHVRVVEITHCLAVLSRWLTA